MAPCDGTIEHGITELEPTPPDENGDRWRNFVATGQLTFSCSHGLTISGPREHVRPLIEAHCGLPSQGSQPLALGRA